MDGLTFNKEQFEADVWYYSGLEGIIKSDTWEQIVANSVNGKVIPGDRFMADVYNDEYCFNVKSIKEQRISKTGNRTVEFVQCRTPIANDRSLSNEDLGVEILATLDNKLKESFEYFDSKKMIDVIILHNRYYDMYHASIYIVDHPDYGSYKLVWSNGEARLENDDKWLIKRRWSDDNHRQTCTSIKKKYFNEQIISNVLIKSIDNHSISKEEILNKYKQYKEINNF